MDNFREIIKKDLKKIFDSNSKIFSVWEGGSAATGYLDELSDLDIGLVCEDEAIEEIFSDLEIYFDEKYNILTKFRLPEPTWHGHSQCYYKLEKTSPFFYIDILIEKLSAKNRLVESDRHGNAKIWFDKKNLLDTSPTPKVEIEKKIKIYYKIMKGYTDFNIIDIKKKIKRGNTIDAMVIYNQLIFRHLAYMLNLQYRVPKHDFGLMYSYRDYPKEINKPKFSL